MACLRRPGNSYTYRPVEKDRRQDGSWVPLVLVAEVFHGRAQVSCYVSHESRCRYGRLSKSGGDAPSISQGWYGYLDSSRLHRAYPVFLTRTGLGSWQEARGDLPRRSLPPPPISGLNLSQIPKSILSVYRGKCQQGIRSGLRSRFTDSNARNNRALQSPPCQPAWTQSRVAAVKSSCHRFHRALLTRCEQETVSALGSLTLLCSRQVIASKTSS